MIEKREKIFQLSKNLENFDMSFSSQNSLQNPISSLSNQEKLLELATSLQNSIAFLLEIYDIREKKKASLLKSLEKDSTYRLDFLDFLSFDSFLYSYIQNVLKCLETFESISQQIIREITFLKIYHNSKDFEFRMQEVLDLFYLDE